MKITVNGESREVDVDTTILALLEELGLNTALVAVERNRAIVPKSQHRNVVLEKDDRVEIVTLVGGG